MKCRDINKIDLSSTYFIPHRTYHKVKEIVGLDTETENGKCFILGKQDNKSYEIVDGFNIDTYLKYLNDGFFKKTFNFFYNVNYDFQAIMKLLPFENLQELAKRDKTIYKDYIINNIPNKMFSIAKLNNKHGKSKFYDISQFFNYKSLNYSANKFLNMNKEDLKENDIDITKLTYEKYLNDTDYRTILNSYLNQDCLITKKLGDVLYNQLTPFMKPKAFYSQAYFSQQYYLENVNRHIKLPSLQILDYAMKSYQGGRFEVFKKGYFDDGYVYDIKSAYPEQNIKVPDISKGKWIEDNEYRSEALISLFKCSVEIYDINISPMKYQLHNNLLIYPIGNFKEVYLNKKEYETIFEMGYDIKIINAYHFISDNPEYPYVFLNDFYLMKEKYKNENQNDLAWIPKILMNGFYGKQIQITKQYEYTKENRGIEGMNDMLDINNETYYEYIKYKAGILFNPIVANEITANTRDKLFNSVKNKMDNVIGFQTDSIITDKAINLKIGNELGDYEIQKEKKPIIMLGSGIYQILDTKPKIKFRGFSTNIDIMKLLSENLNETDITTNVKRNFKLKKVMKLKMSIEEKMKLFNLIKDEKKVINLNFDRKRVWDRDFVNAKDVLENQIDSKPIII